MRLAAFRRLGEPDPTRHVGLVLGDGAGWSIHPFANGTELVALLAADRDEREAAADVAAQGDGLHPDEVVLLPPVYPVAMRDFLTFEAHVEGMERGQGNAGTPEEWYDAPVFLFMAPHAVTGPHDDVAMPPDTERLEFELEIAARVNAVQLGADRSGHMGWSFEQLVSHASRASLVKAGEVLAYGTCASGSLAESWGRTGSLTPAPLEVGDVVEMTIERLGTIRN